MKWEIDLEIGQEVFILLDSSSFTPGVITTIGFCKTKDSEHLDVYIKCDAYKKEFLRKRDNIFLTKEEALGALNKLTQQPEREL